MLRTLHQIGGRFFDEIRMLQSFDYREIALRVSVADTAYTLVRCVQSVLRKAVVLELFALSFL
jgi:hypothetical protein